MFRKFRSQFRLPRTSGAPSLTWILFPSVLLVMVMAFLTVQVLGIVPGPTSQSLMERMRPANLAVEASSSLHVLLLIAGLMMTGIFVALRLGLRSLRKISEQAVGIGPATINKRLPLNSTPREILPLVIAFNETLDRLEVGLRAQREFSANAAHELRTPLATLRAQVESVLEPADRKDAIEEFERLGRLITQLLDLAEVENGADLGATSFDLVALARTVTTQMAGTIVNGGRNITFETVHAHLQRQGSPGLMEVAIRNLLENATRHTPVGAEIVVSIGDRGHLRVADDGPGVSSHFRDRLFQRFSKADAHGVGAGLGLSIVRQVMLLHEGDAWLETTPVGACFVLDFCARDDAGRVAATALQAATT